MVRIAAVQRAPLFDDPEAAVGVMRGDLRWAADENIDLIVFPEAFLYGYGHDAQTVERRAIALQDSSFRSLLAASAESPAVAVVGFFERRGDVIFNSAAVVQGGTLLGLYAKHHPSEHGVTAGSSMPAFSLGPTSFSINICADANHRETAAKAAATGASILAYPLNNMLPRATAERWRTKSIENLIGRARENSVWTVSADVVGRVGDLISFGCTAIVSPDGVVEAQVPEERAGRITIDTDRASDESPQLTGPVTGVRQ